MNTKLKPCPFCGGSQLDTGHNSDLRNSGNATDFYIACQQDGGMVWPSVRGLDEEQAARLWNQRARTGLSRTYLLDALKHAETEMRYAGFNIHKLDNVGQMPAWAAVVVCIGELEKESVDA